MEEPVVVDLVADQCATHDLADLALVLTVVLQQVAQLSEDMEVLQLVVHQLIQALDWMKMASTNISFTCADFLTELLSRRYPNFSYLSILSQFELSSIEKIARLEKLMLHSTHTQMLKLHCPKTGKTLVADMLSCFCDRQTMAQIVGVAQELQAPVKTMETTTRTTLTAAVAVITTTLDTAMATNQTTAVMVVVIVAIAAMMVVMAMTAAMAEETT